MIAASHMVAGAAIGTVCPRARVALPLAFVSHFVLDQIPHSCFNMLPETAWSGLAGVFAYTGLVIDGLIILAVAVLAWRARRRWVVMAAAVAATLPDPLSYMPPINQWFALIPGSWVVPWVHSTFHSDVTLTNPALGFATQVVVVAVGLYILARKGPKAQETAEPTSP